MNNLVEFRSLTQAKVPLTEVSCESEAVSDMTELDHCNQVVWCVLKVIQVQRSTRDLFF